MARKIIGTAVLAVLIGGSLQARDVASSSDASARQRAIETEQRMTDEERTVLTSGITAIPHGEHKVPAMALPGAGYIDGIARLGIPALKETDGGLGVSWALGARGNEGATALPSATALAASWNPDLAREAGRMIGSEAKALGFNVLLGGGVNLIRDPRAGRNFEYFSEDPLLSGVMAGNSIAGIQSNHIIATVKHFAFNNQETGRKFGNVVIGEAAARESELLAFKLAIELGKPGSVMCAYNLVNGEPACGNAWLLDHVLKQDWRFPGFVMSDWGTVHSVDYAWAGLDQQSGRESDPAVYLGSNLLDAARGNAAREARLADMNRRILYAIYAAGLDRDTQVSPLPIDRAANEQVAAKVAQQGIVLLKNRRGILPLTATVRSIAVIGGFADIGMLSGGGSSQVHSDGGPAAMIPGGGKGLFNGWEQYQRGTTPLDAIRQRAGTSVAVTFSSGNYPSEAVEQARKAEVAIVFANQWETEGRDLPDLTLPRGQDALIEAVAAANQNTIVVLQTGSAVTMPWLDKSAAVLEAWYPGVRGGEVIAATLFGDVNPSGRLPITFPANTDQLPHPTLPGQGEVDPDLNGSPKPGQSMTIDYNVEGSDVGYRWFARKRLKPFFPFGYGLSYTTFSSSRLTINGLNASLTISNTGQREGVTVAQIYLTEANGERKERLVGFKRVNLAPSSSRKVTFAIDPRLLADWKDGEWAVSPGTYTFAAGDNAETLGPAVTTRIKALRFKD